MYFNLSSTQIHQCVTDVKFIIQNISTRVSIFALIVMSTTETLVLYFLPTLTNSHRWYENFMNVVSLICFNYNRILLVLEWHHVIVVTYIFGNKDSLHLSTLHAIIILTSAKIVHGIIALATLMEILLLCLLKEIFCKLTNYIISFVIMRDTLYF